MPIKNITNCITSLLMDGLEGRLLHLPAPKNAKREILLVYGHHSSLERWWGVAQELNQYGAVTMPDLPGLGGMQSLYKIGQKPTIDNLADYLAAFVKMRYSHKKVTIVGLSFGFVIITRMLQRHPELSQRVDLLVSIRGFAHKDDFKFNKNRHVLYLCTARICSHLLPAIFIKNIYTVFLKRHDTHDARTTMRTYAECLELNNCGRRVELPVWHVYAAQEQYLDNQIVEQHMNVIFSNVYPAEITLVSGSPNDNNKKTAAALLPPQLRKALSK